VAVEVFTDILTEWQTDRQTLCPWYAIW